MNYKSIIQIGIGIVLFCGITFAVWDGFFPHSPSTTASQNKEMNPAEIEKPIVGHRAPNFFLNDLQGKSMELQTGDHKPTVINFWATWCEPCKQEMPLLQDAYQKHSQHVNFVMVNVTDQDQVDLVREYVKKYKYTFPVYLDEVGDVSDLYRVNSIPSTYIVDHNGTIIQSKMGTLSKEELDSYLGQIGVK